MSSSSTPGEDADPGPVLVVLGAAVWPGGEPSPALRRRMRWAVELYRQTEGRPDEGRRDEPGSLLLTGGLGRHPPAEAEVMAALARAGGVPAERLVQEPEGRTTWDSARRCAPLIQAHGWREVILVTDPWHLPRARLAFAAFGIRSRPCPICRGRAGSPRGLLLAQSLRELVGLPVYLLRALLHRARRHRTLLPRRPRAH